MKTSFLILASSLLLSMSHAGESGFMYQGKSYPVYKDGKKVGKSIEEFNAEQARSPSAVTIKKAHPINSKIVYEEDEISRCYRTEFSSEQIFCVKLK